MSSRIIVVGHDAFRAGAQIGLLRVVRWLRDHHVGELSLVLSDGGPLLADYDAVLPTRVLPPRATPTSSSRLVAAARRGRHQLEQRAERWPRGSADLVYANSIAAAPAAARIASEAGCPAVCHVHELEMSIRESIGVERFDELSSRFERFIAVSQAVADNLVTAHGVSRQRISLVPAPIPGRVDGARPAGAQLPAIPEGAFVVGGCGTAEWRKGVDLFVLVAKALADRAYDLGLHFVWVGGEPGALGRVEHDLQRLGLTSTVHLVGEQADPEPFFARFDAFLLPSREDPFPLVCLEAASHGVPIVCFADAGGMPEFVEHDAGFVVPYLDLAAAADRLAELARDGARRAALGRRAAEKVAERCSIDVVGPQIAAALDQCLMKAAS